jgi:hypothetical protein
VGLYNFKERFAGPILDGSKTHTIRPKRKNADRPGKTCHLFTGLRTRNAALLLRAPCIRVQEILITQDRCVVLDGAELDEDEKNSFAFRDGFRAFGVDRAFEEMMRFWESIHRLPFEGHVVHWDYSKRVYK